MLVLPNQQRGVLERYGISRVDADSSVWALTRDGRRWEGAAAINRVLHEIDRPWSALASLNRLAPMAAIEEIFYGWFSRNRAKFHRFGVRPECDDADSDCE